RRDHPRAVLTGNAMKEERTGRGFGDGQQDLPQLGGHMREHQTLPVLLRTLPAQARPSPLTLCQQRDVPIPDVGPPRKRTRACCHLLRPAQVDDGLEAQVQQCSQTCVSELRRIVRAQQRAPACCRAIHGWIPTEVADIVQARNVQDAARIVQVGGHESSAASLANSRFSASTRSTYTRASWSPQRWPAVSRNPRRAYSVPAPTPHRWISAARFCFCCRVAQPIRSCARMSLTCTSR